MANTDSLIDELFPHMHPKSAGGETLNNSFDDPDSPNKMSMAGVPSPKVSRPPAKGCGFDSDEEENATGKTSNNNVTKAAPVAASKKPGNNSFDDSDEDNENDETAARHITFPAIPSTISNSSAPSDICVLSNVPDTPLHDHYGGQRRLQLQAVAGLIPSLDPASGESPHSAGVSLKMNTAIAKRYPFAAYLNAFHVTHPHAGNGVDTNNGSPFVFCLKCDHVVSRLQDAAWADAFEEDGTTMKTNCPAAATSSDLYLVVRYFYPDWCRFLTQPLDSTDSTPCTPSTSTPPSQAVARSCPPSASGQRWAAYACQCSWATVGVPGLRFTTTMMDLAKYRHATKDGEAPQKFVTVITPDNVEELANAGGQARLPLWISKGPSPS